MLVVPGLILSEEPSTLFVAKLFLSAIGFLLLCLSARLYVLARKRERSVSDDHPIAGQFRLRWMRQGSGAERERAKRT